MNKWIKGMDLSSLLEVERAGGRFFCDGMQMDAMDILKEHGMNLVRLRLWNEPYTEDGISYGGGGCDIENVLALARRASEKGIGWMLDFHYSDCWADPGKQTLPKAWREKDAEELEQAVYDFTLEVLERCKKEALMPQIAAIGNELTSGLLWPYGKVPEYGNIVKFLNAGIHAAKDADSSLPVMLHLDNGGNRELYRTWFDAYLENGGEDFEYIGLSYYPFWHGSLAMLQENMEAAARRYHKKMIVTEVSSGFTLEDYQNYEKLKASDRKGMTATAKLAERVPYPMTKQGQADFMTDFLNTICKTPDGLCEGFCYWEPAWLPVPGSHWATPQACEYMGDHGPGGNEWANQALFDYDGNTLPALNVIRDFHPPEHQSIS